MNNSLTKQALRNTIYNSIGWFWPIAINLFTTPYVVLSLGKDAYGILGIIGVILGYFALLDMGIGAGNIKYVSEYLLNKEFKKINEVINSLFLIYLIIGIITFFCVFLLSNILVDSVFKVPAKLHETAIFSFRVAAIGFPFALLNNVFAAVPKAFHRFDIQNKIQLIIGTLSTLSIVLIIYLGYGFKEVVLIKFFDSIIYFITNWFFVKRLLPTFKLNFRLDTAIFRKLFSFGVWDLFIKLSNLSVTQLGRMVIGIVLGTASLTFYYIPQSLIDRINSFTFKISEIIFPIASQLSTLNDFGRLNKIYYKMSKYLFMFKLSLYIPICLLSYKILLYWIGKEFADNGYIVMIILSIGFFIQSLTHLPGLITYGVAKLQITSKYTLINFCILALLIFPLTKIFGIVGTCVSYTISTLPYIFYLLHINSKILNISNIDFIYKCLFKPLLIGVFQIIIIIIIRSFCDGIVSVMILFITSFLIYHGIGFLLKCYEDNELKAIINSIPVFRTLKT